VGAIAPVPWVTEELLREIKDTIVAPCVQGLKKRGRPFVGVLYPGIMVTAEGPKVIEFNARFGDPEAQAYMRLLKTDLVEIMRACINNDIKKITVEWRSASACCVIATSGGYPEKYEEGKLIRGLETAMRSDVVIFHSGTKKVGHDFVTHGGRVLGVTAVAESLEKSLQTSYTAMQKVTFDGMYFRKDIGLKSL
jgi:phosphoribosylamine--glycine ligase